MVEVRLRAGWLQQDVELAARRAKELEPNMSTTELIRTTMELGASPSKRWADEAIRDCLAEITRLRTALSAAESRSSHLEGELRQARKKALEEAADNLDTPLLKAAVQEFDNVIVLTREEAMACAIAHYLRAAAEGK
jgi:predicted RNase H-like nuclease (RuvC/YqgF family)